MSDITKLMQEISLLKSQLAMLQNDLEARRSDEINAVITRDMQPRQVLTSQEPVIEPWDLHYSLDSANVTLSAGYVFWGLKTMTVSASGPNAVTDGDCWGIEVSLSSATWVKKSAPTDFVDTDELMREFYYKFSVSDGVASIAEIGAKGNWKIPSTFAPEA